MKKTPSQCVVRLAAVIVLAAAFLGPASKAQATLETANATSEGSHDIGHALVQVDEMATQAQRITTSLLLSGLDVAPKANLARAQKSLTFIDRMIQVARQGDPAMKLEAPSDPELLATVEVVEQLWAQLRPTFEGVIKTKKLRPEDVEVIAKNHLVLVKGILAMQKEFLRVLGQKNLVSILAYTAQQSEHLSFLIEEMASDLLLIVYGHDVQTNKLKLAKDQAIFQAALTDLIHGNPEKRLIAAPNEQIRAQLGKVKVLWEQFRPILEATAEGGMPSRQVLQTLVPLIETLYDEMATAAAYYDQL